MKSTSLSRNANAFSLVELLVTIAIIAALAGGGALALRDGGGSVQAAAKAASSIFNLARTEAILRRTEVRVIVDSNYQASQPGNYLRRLAVAARNEDGSWELITRWQTLPGSAFFNPALSQEHGIEEMPGTGTGALMFFEFRPNGQASEPRGQFIVARGRQEDGVFIEHGESNRSGFFVHRLGKISFFQSPTDIPPT